MAGLHPATQCRRTQHGSCVHERGPRRNWSIFESFETDLMIFIAHLMMFKATKPSCQCDNFPKFPVPPRPRVGRRRVAANSSIGCKVSHWSKDMATLDPKGNCTTIWQQGCFSFNISVADQFTYAHFVTVFYKAFRDAILNKMYAHLYTILYGTCSSYTPYFTGHVADLYTILYGACSLPIHHTLRDV